MAENRTPLTEAQLETIQKIANSLSQSHDDQLIRNVIVDLLEEVRAGREIWTMAAEVYAGFRRQLLDELGGNAGASSLVIVCRACRNTPAGCNASGCGGRQEKDWRGKLPAGTAAADQPLVPQLDAPVLALLDGVLWAALKALERGMQAVMYQGLDVPPVLDELVSTLRRLVDQSDVAQGRPF